jgi:hypothetical protein
MSLQGASPRRGDSPILITQQPNSANPPVRRSRNSISRKRKSFVEKFLFTFGTKKGFKRLKKATQNFFAFVSMIVVGVAGVISLIASIHVRPAWMKSC